jgi:DNA-binding transcriptional LysR family regulator
MGDMSPELRDIRYFAAVVEHGSLTRAASALRVSQPTLTHAIARLEQQLEGPVWQRLRNRRAGVVPTELGRRVLERGRRAVFELDALAQDAALLRGLGAGELRVGTIQSLASTLLPLWVSRYSSEHPGIKLDLPLVTSAEAAGLVREGRLDAALVVAAQSEAGLTRMRCAEQEVVAVVRADHPLAKARCVELSALSGEHFVLVPAQRFAAVDLEAVCQKAGFRPQVRCRIASIGGVCALVRAGVGVSLLPEGSVPPGDRSLCELRLARHAPRRAVHLLYRDDDHPSPALSAWLDVGRAVVGRARKR